MTNWHSLYSKINRIVQKQPTRRVLKKRFLKIYSKFTGEHPCRSVISMKLKSNFIEIALRHGCSPVSLLHIFRTPFPRSFVLNEDVLKTSFVFVFGRRLQDVLVKTNIFVLAIRLQDVLPRRLQDVFKTSSRHLQDVFKTYHQVKLFLLTRLWEAFNRFLRRSFPKTIIYRGICPAKTTSDKFMVSVQNLQER